MQATPSRRGGRPRRGPATQLHRDTTECTMYRWDKFEPATTTTAVLPPREAKPSWVPPEPPMPPQRHWTSTAAARRGADPSCNLPRLPPYSSRFCSIELPVIPMSVSQMVGLRTATHMHFASSSSVVSRGLVSVALLALCVLPCSVALSFALFVHGFGRASTLPG